MIGSFDVEVENSHVNYRFTIRRNITIFSGDSATRKSTLVNMISDYQRQGTNSGVTLRCDRDCAVLPECFEWLILKSGIITGRNLPAIVDDTPSYVDSAVHFSWERFFCHELTTRTQNTFQQYG